MRRSEEEGGKKGGKEGGRMVKGGWKRRSEEEGGRLGTLQKCMYVRTW